MMNFRIGKVVGACALLVSSVLPIAAQQLPKPLVPVTQDFTLPNGLRVLLSEDHSAPVASVVLVYNVGSRNEERGRSGFAHFFEHMMFQGSQNVGKMEHMKYIGAAGGSCNASTHNDYTNYYDRVPSNQVNTALWLESDRMRSLKVTPENFKNQLETVKEEKRLRIDNQPYQPASMKVDELTFDNWANAHAVIGTFEDLDSSKLDDVKQFFKTYYAPNDAVLAVVGDIDSNEVHKTIEKYFSDIPRQPTPPQPNVAETTPPKSKYEKVEDQHAEMPAFWMSWRVPPMRDPDFFPLQIAEKILSEGDSSRLYQKMVKGDQIALRADAGLDRRRGPSAFSTFVIYKPNTTAEKAREVVWSELDRLKNQPVSAEELQKAKNQIMRDYFSSNGYTSLQKTLGKAELLAKYTAFWGDPKFIDQDIDRLMKVSPEDIERVAKKYLTHDTVVVVDVQPTKHQAEAPHASTKG